MDGRDYDRLMRPGDRESDRRAPLAETRRVVLVGTDEASRLLSTYAFEEVGYVVYAAADERQALAFVTRLLPDVVVVQPATPGTLDMLARLAEMPSTFNIPVVVLISSTLQSDDARHARAAGGITMAVEPADVETLVGEVDSLIAAAPRAQRALKRRLLDLQELARHYTPDAAGRARLRRLIDHLQVAIFAVDEQGQCVAASDGATLLTGYSRLQLLTSSVWQAAFASGHISEERWQVFLANRQYAGTTTITTRAGADVTVHAAAVAEVLPGLHIAAFAAA
jgi:PAS domain S-box-containing protein